MATYMGNKIFLLKLKLNCMKGFLSLHHQYKKKSVTCVVSDTTDNSQCLACYTVILLCGSLSPEQLATE